MIITMATNTLCNKCKGFTLTEVLIATSMGGLILTAILTIFTYICKAEVAFSLHFTSEQVTQQLLQQFGQDVRQARDATLDSPNKLTLLLGTNTIIYEYKPNSKIFTRTALGSTAPLAKQVSNFEFKAFTLTGVEITEFPHNTNKPKLLQLSLTTSSSKGQLSSNRSLVSAKYILRNTQ